MNQYVMELADGRSLGVAEWGPPGAPVVVYCHGFPGNRLEPSLAVSVLERHDVAARVIAFDRPGYGWSTAVPHRRILDWPRDVAEAADRLGIDDLVILGASGGCPFALACGVRLVDRVTRIGIVAGTGPVEAPGMRATPMISGTSRFRLARRLRWRLVALAAKTGRLDRVIDRAIATMTDVDKAAMERPEVRRWFGEVFAEAFARGGAAAALEGELLRQDWGFELEDVEAETHIWHGTADQWVPRSAATWLADRLPSAHLVLWPEHGHFSWATASEVADVIAVMTEHGRERAERDGH